MLRLKSGEGWNANPFRLHKADGTNSGHPVGKLMLAVLENSEDDRAMLEVLPIEIEDDFSLPSSKSDTMKDEIVQEIHKGSATVKRKDDRDLQP